VSMQRARVRAEWVELMRSPPRSRAAGYRAAISCFGPLPPLACGAACLQLAKADVGIIMDVIVGAASWRGMPPLRPNHLHRRIGATAGLDADRGPALPIPTSALRCQEAPVSSPGKSMLDRRSDTYGRVRQALDLTDRRDGLAGDALKGGCNATPTNEAFRTEQTIATNDRLGRRTLRGKESTPHRLHGMPHRSGLRAMPRRREGNRRSANPACPLRSREALVTFAVDAFQTQQRISAFSLGCRPL
jgi:hypothetical protein